MNLRVLSVFLGLSVLASSPTQAGLTLSKEEMISLTPKWQGERYPDGRPQVPSELLDRMKTVSMEEAWDVLRGEGYRNQFEGGWQMIRQDKPVVGRALTAVYMPSRPDLSDQAPRPACRG